MHGIDEWHDVLRLILFLVGAYCIFILCLQWKSDRRKWDEPLGDLWFALLMWALTGCVVLTQSITQNQPFSPMTVFLTAAILVTGKMLHSRWRS